MMSFCLSNYTCIAKKAWRLANSKLQIAASDADYYILPSSQQAKCKFATCSFDFSFCLTRQITKKQQFRSPSPYRDMRVAVHEGRSHKGPSKSAGSTAAAAKVSKKVPGGPSNKHTPALPWQPYYYAPPPAQWNWVYVPYYQGAYAPPMNWNPTLPVPPKMRHAKKRDKKGGTGAAAAKTKVSDDGGGLAFLDTMNPAKFMQGVAKTEGRAATEKTQSAAAALASLTSPSSSAAAALLELACAFPKTTFTEEDKKELTVFKPAPLAISKKRPASQDSSDVRTAPVKKKQHLGGKAMTRKQRKINDSWDRGFELLQRFHQENSHCSVPKGYVVDSVDLSDFVIMQRRAYEMWVSEKTTEVPVHKECIDKLNSIGFVWSFMDPDKLWNRSFDLLCAFVSKNGHCHVPKGYVAKEVDLFRWVNNQRTYYKRFLKWHMGGDALITQARIDRLNAIDFEWKSSSGVEQKRKDVVIQQSSGTVVGPPTH